MHKRRWHCPEATFEIATWTELSPAIAAPRITSTQLTHWSTVVPWISGDLVEQDLVLSRLIVEIAQDPYLGGELVFRGGTCLHKLYDTGLARYSEDLDYVQRSGGGIGDLTRAVTSIGERLGMDVRTKIGATPRSSCKHRSSPAQGRWASRSR